MTSPSTVRTTPFDEDVGCAKPMTALIAYIGNFECESAEGVEKYVELGKNRLFYSNYLDPQIAYLEMVETCRKIKDQKLRKSAALKQDMNTRMVTIMRMCVLAFFENMKHKAGTEFDIRSLPMMLKKNSQMISEVSEAYFKTGLGQKLCVNNPRKIYAQCVEQHELEILECVKGERKMSGNDLQIFAEALTHFTK